LDSFRGDLSYSLPLLVGFGLGEVDHGGRLSAMGSMRPLVIVEGDPFRDAGFGLRSGLPVFAGTPPAVAGPAYLLGPTGGYLIGFLLCAVVSGFVAQRLSGTRPVSGAFLAVLSGSIAIYMPGLAWLGSFLGYDEKLLAAGLYPFVSGDVTKAAIACVLFMIFRDSHVLRRIR